MMKCKFIILIVTIMVLMASTTAVANRDIHVIIDGNQVEFDVAPTILEGRTLVPMRTIFEALGVLVEWEPESKTVIGTKDKTKIQLTIDQPIAKKDGEDIALDIPAKIIEGRTLVPVRFISESLGCNVEWDNDTKTVIIKTCYEWIEDENLERVVREQLGKPNQTLTKSDLESITTLKAYPSDIYSIEGIQHLSNLETLELPYNFIDDLTPISHLKKLKTLDLTHNKIEDISPIRQLYDLEVISLGNNQIKDLSPLENLLNLSNIDFFNNQISDIGPIANLTNLKNIYLNHNKIEDINPLKNLVNLEYLGLGENLIVDVDVLENLIQMKTLELHNNQISDMSSLIKLNNLEFLVIGGNPADSTDVVKAFENIEIIY